MGRDGEEWGWYCAAACSAGDIQARIPFVAGMGRLLERLERAALALDHLRLAWALSAREAWWTEFAARSRDAMEAFPGRQASQPGLRPERPEALPDPEPPLARCRQAWAVSRR